MGAKGAKIPKKNTTDLTEEEIQLLLTNTHFNRQQITEWHTGFIVSIIYSLYNLNLKFVFLLYFLLFF